jgi:hypothetical protein
MGVGVSVGGRGVEEGMSVLAGVAGVQADSIRATKKIILARKRSGVGAVIAGDYT